VKENARPKEITSGAGCSHVDVGRSEVDFKLYQNVCCLYSVLDLGPVVKVRGAWGGSASLLPFEPPYNSMSPLIESIKCYFMHK